MTVLCPVMTVVYAVMTVLYAVMAVLYAAMTVLYGPDDDPGRRFPVEGSEREASAGMVTPPSSTSPCARGGQVVSLSRGVQVVSPARGRAVRSRMCPTRAS